MSAGFFMCEPEHLLTYRVNDVSGVVRVDEATLGTSGGDVHTHRLLAPFHKAVDCASEALGALTED